MADSETRPAAFLDRDGVLNREVGYAHRADQIVWMPGAMAAVRRLNQAGYRVLVVTNQAGVARGLYSTDDVERLHRWMSERLAENGARIDDWRYCPFHPDFPVERFAHLAGWRKPAPGMLLDLMANWPVDRSGSFLIGDRTSDMQAAAAAGIEGHRYADGDLDSLVAGLLRRTEADASDEPEMEPQ